MTFQRSLYISICIHVLVFGSAIAFAQFARGALWGNRDAVMVSLVGSGPGPTGRTLERAGHRERQSDDRPVVTNKTTSPAIQPEMPAHKPSAQEETSIPANKESRRSDPGDAGAPQGQGGPVQRAPAPARSLGSFPQSSGTSLSRRSSVQRTIPEWRGNGAFRAWSMSGSS